MYDIGYTTGVFDLFHIGHIRLLRSAKELCNKLIVGVTTDEAASYKGKTPILSWENRYHTVQACKYVDVVIPQHDVDKYEAWKRLKYNVLFVGDDWYDTQSWNEYENKLKKYKVNIVYLPYTSGISTTDIINDIKNLRD